MGDPDSLRLAAIFAEKALALPDEKEQTVARYVRGIARCKLYEVGGDPITLRDGVADLRLVYDAVRKDFSPQFELLVGTKLAVALVRSGEQQGDVAVLREGAALATIMLAGGQDVDRSVLVNAKAVAELRIGALGGDTALVESAVRSLRTHLKTVEPSSQEEVQTFQNLCAALMQNARQTQSVRVYSEVLTWLEDKCHPINNDVSAYYALYFAQASAELFAITGEADRAQRGLLIIDELIARYADNSFRRLEALHSRAQLHFQLGKRGDGEMHFSAAIASTEAALALTTDGGESINTRRHRLLADLGVYTYALGLTTGQKDLIERAKSHYTHALQSIGPAKAPVLFATVARGLYYLHYEQKEWKAALDVFGKMEAAWDRVFADPNLSSAVHQQSTRELAGWYTRAGLARLAIGDTAEAMLTLDRGRARQLHLATMGLHLDAFENLSPESLDHVTIALSEVTRARGSGTETDCRVAWDAYLNARRQAGLDGHVDHLTFTDLCVRVPVGGAIVQLLIGHDGSYILLLKNGEQSVRCIPLARESPSPLNELVDGTLSRQWFVAYQQFVGDHRPVVADASPHLEDANWYNTVERCRRVLGSAVFDKVHESLVECGLEEGAQVVICPPGQFGYLPLAAATLSDGSAFGDHWTVSVAPRISALHARTISPHAEHRVGFLLPNSDHNQQLAPLPQVAREVRLISERLPAGTTRCVEHLNDGMSEIVQIFEAVSIVHAACHATYNWTEPDLSGLELGDDHRVSIRRLSASTKSLRDLRLVVLSSCESAVSGASALPDEFIGLPVAFLQAGARAVIGTLWPVFDDVAMATMARFYELFLDERGRERMAPARALANAQAWVRDASLRDLLDAEYFTRAGIDEMLPSRAHSTSARRRMRGLKFVGVNNAISTIDRTTTLTVSPQTPDELSYRPYASATDWAAFVLLGN